MKHSIQNLPDDAKVWVYQANKVLSGEQLDTLIDKGNVFISEWAAHGASLKASFDVFYNRFVVIAVDEQQAMASGCSIDKSVKFMKEIGQQLGVDFFDRMQVAYIDKEDNVVSCSLNEFEKLANQNHVDENTIVFNNMVTTKAEFDSNWQIPLKNSWQSRVLA